MEESLTNGMERTTSRKKRPNMTEVTPIDSFPQPPLAPEVPKAPPVSYRPPQTNGFESRPAKVYPGSFAQRAAVLTGRKIPPDPATFDPEAPAVPTPAKRERRTSLNRPIGGVYTEIQQHRRDSYPSTASPTSPRRASNPQKIPQPQNRSSISSTPRSIAQSPEQDVYQRSPVDQTTRRKSAGVALPRTETWASDRSPLQKLEVKLSDISKEEKRARVEKAEQRLRESKLTAQRDTLRSLETTNGAPARRASASNSDTKPTRLQQTPYKKEMDERESQPQDLTHGQSKRTSERKNSISIRNRQNERGVRFQNMNELDSVGLNGGISQGDADNQQKSSKTEKKRASEQDQLPREDFRQSSSDVQTVPRKVPSEQHDLYTSKVQPSRELDTAAAFGGQPDPVPGHAVTGRRQVPKHEVPPQTAAGIQARQKVGFDSDPQHITEVPTHRKHHLTDVLHHRRVQAINVLPPTVSNPRHLDEWRYGGVGKLTADDFLDDPGDNSPWWENSASSSRRRFQRANVSEKDAYQEGSGKHIISLSQEATGPAGHPPSFKQQAPTTTHTRQYISNDVFKRPKRSALARLKGKISMLSLRIKESRQTGLVSAYSYSCPHLAKHDPSHIKHICEPYLSKELTQSMRSIRVRLAPNLASFSPPLYLKCGPLLRYTGIKRDRLQSQGRSGPQSSERETWRGSVMIVTADADSYYDPAPILRLFPEPMEKLPSPQSKSDADTGEDLPIHYLDPVAGLPKLSRTGKTIYVKPVDDLQQGIDLSRIETNDDGLFEDFRTAAVPTAYGTPEYRHGQNGPSPRQTDRGRKPKQGHRVKGVRLHAERGVTFWRFNLEVELQNQETRIAYSINNSPAVGFWVPARGHTMNVMFHSCNGFSLSVKLVSSHPFQE